MEADRITVALNFHAIRARSFPERGEGGGFGSAPNPGGRRLKVTHVSLYGAKRTSTPVGGSGASGLSSHYRLDAAARVNVLRLRSKQSARTDQSLAHI